MNINDFITHVTQIGIVTYDMPFDEKTLVFRVGGKIFLLTNLDDWELNHPKINIKATPENVQTYITENDFVNPGYHMNKKHWITINLAETNKIQTILNWISDSYMLVYNSLPKKVKDTLHNQ